MNVRTIKQFRERVKRIMCFLEAIQNLPKEERVKLIRTRLQRVINQRKKHLANGDYYPRRHE